MGYDGSRFAGSQRQPRARTVEGVLEDAWSEVTGEDVRIRLAGRTDAGVHAERQVGSVSTGCGLSAEDLAAGLASRLPPDLWLLEIEAAPDGFDPRRRARWRAYRYEFGPEPAVYLDERRMQEAGSVLVGEHDFAAFASSSRLGPRGAVRRVFELRVRRASARVVVMECVADAFLRQMVRRIASALVLVGTGKIGDSEIEAALELRDPRLLPGPAPAEHLTLIEVGYGDYDEDLRAPSGRGRA